MKSWVVVFKSKLGHKAEIVKDVLIDNGVGAVIMNKKDTAYNMFGQFEVNVAPEHAVRAIRVIENDIKFD